MPPDQLRSSIHRFRVRSGDPPTRPDSPRRRSASPPQEPPLPVPLTQATPPATPPTVPRGTRSCDRCRTFKKRCSRTYPTCSLCQNAGQKCSLSWRPSHANPQVLQQLEERVRWLSHLVNSKLALPSDVEIQSVETGAEIDALLDCQLSPGQGNIKSGSSHHQGAQNETSEILEHQEQDLESLLVRPPALFENSGLASIPEFASSSPEVPRQGDGLGKAAEDASSLSAQNETPQHTFLGASAASLDWKSLAQRCIDAYFRHVNRAYPFIQKNDIMGKLDPTEDWHSLKALGDSSSTLLCLIIAIGCTTLKRAGQIPKEAGFSFDIAYSDIVQRCLAKEDIDSLKILVLVALYSLFDPNGMSTWVITGIAARQAMLLGLGRRKSNEECHSATEAELRRRLFWSIWVLDRVTAFANGLPAALTDEGHDVPLPGLTVEEFASSDRPYYASILQTNRHIIQLRQLEHRILEQVHLRSQAEITSLSQADRRAIVRDITSGLENWYSNGCLVSQVDADNVPIHSSVTWLSTRYYHALLFLHYPCPFNSGFAMISHVELLRLAQKCVQLTSVLLQQRQLPLNRVTLCRMFPVGLVILHCSISCANEDFSALSARDDVATIVRIFEAFPEEWAPARQAARIFRLFFNAIIFSDPMLNRPIKSSLRSVIDSLVKLMGEVLGKSTCYTFDELQTPEKNAAVVFDGSQAHLQASMLPNGPAMYAAFLGNASNFGTSPLDYDMGSADLAYF